MRKHLLAALIATELALLAPQAHAVLFFSEYIEGSSNNKALEIYNAGMSPVDLTAGNWNVQMFFNGNTSAGLTIDLMGTVAPGDVFVLAQSSADAAILAEADQTNGAGWFNGDDAITLNMGGAVIDSFGQIGVDPGSQWFGGGVGAQDATLRRKPSILMGDADGTDAFDPSLEWDAFANNTFDGLGAHMVDAPPPPPPPDDGFDNTKRIMVMGPMDDFDDNRGAVSFTVDPDNSANNGAFPGATDDVFGITDRTVDFDFADDSLSIFPADMFGILREGKTDRVFGVEDLTNPDNTGGTGTATWEFDVSGLEDVSVQIDFAAMGDFEAANDSFIFSASIDGGAPINLFVSSVDEAGDLTYFLESGTMVTINDPLLMNGQVLSNQFQTLSSDIIGEGSLLTLTFSAGSDGGGEVFVFDNIAVKGFIAVPEPGTALLAAMGVGALLLRRRPRRASLECAA